MELDLERLNVGGIADEIVEYIIDMLYPGFRDEYESEGVELLDRVGDSATWWLRDLIPVLVREVAIAYDDLVQRIESEQQ